ncbi:Retrotransposon protein [Phytophthora palmivora]|uniref:Retrotransposon protein n=1 Tax=Phytophthora palmivora TaxID=4796 RepID=A0A2P4XW81_9STRA|nr:Retrotransposon protein [Phytophthora palmivora]
MSYKKGAKEKRTKVNYERLMSDTCGMGKFIPGTETLGSRYKWCYPIKKKSDSNANTMMLIKKLIAQGHRIKTFTSDNGGEFVNNELYLS